MAYWEWGDRDNGRVLLCVHGLTRTGRDFDTLARRLCGHFRVICPDVAGRGRSDWLVDPAGYAVPQYVSDMFTLIARLKPQSLSWVGTSMGGLIALGLQGALVLSEAGRPDRGMFGLPADAALRLDKLVLNDIGPAINGAGLARIGDYVGAEVGFDTYEEAVRYVQSVSEGFGPHTPEQWETLARHVFNRVDGRWVKHYDLRLAQAMAAQRPEALQAAERILWMAYESLACPILLIRGRQSDLLLAESAREMLLRNARARMVEYDGVGHAPTLLTDEQTAPIEHFLLDDSATRRN